MEALHTYGSAVLATEMVQVPYAVQHPNTLVPYPEAEAAYALRHVRAQAVIESQEIQNAHRIGMDQLPSCHDVALDWKKLS